MDLYWKLNGFLLKEFDDGSFFWSELSEKNMHQCAWYFKPVIAAMLDETRIEKECPVQPFKFYFWGNIIDYDNGKKWADTIHVFDQIDYYVKVDAKEHPIFGCKTGGEVVNEVEDLIKKYLRFPEMLTVNKRYRTNQAFFSIKTEAFKNDRS